LSVLFLTPGRTGHYPHGIRILDTDHDYYLSMVTRLCLFVLLLSVSAFAQKGFPPKETVAATVVTHFPQIDEFKAEKIKSLSLSKDFIIDVAAQGLGKPRMMAAGQNGAVYITRRDQGDVLLLSDPNGDGKFEEMKTVLVKFPGVHGIAIREKFLYLCSNRELKRAQINPDGTLGKTENLINDLPDGGQHGNRTLAFGPDGLLYITVGSTCNDCNETNPENATILRATVDGKERKIYARGLRNTIGVDWHPVTKELWGADNGTDWRGDDLPPEELNKIIEGGDYGWPLVYADQQVDPTREDPPGSTKDAYAKTTQPSALTFPAHSAPINLMFMDQVEGISEDYKDDALVTLHGSWNKKEPDGYKIVRVKFEDGKPVGTEDFLSGFLSKDGQSRFGRPAGLVTSSTGHIYVSDDANGIIYKISAATTSAEQNSKP
jgi:glucose/arabinose dehydrogenase